MIRLAHLTQRESSQLLNCDDDDDDDGDDDDDDDYDEDKVGSPYTESSQLLNCEISFQEIRTPAKWTLTDFIWKIHIPKTKSASNLVHKL